MLGLVRHQTSIPDALEVMLNDNDNEISEFARRIPLKFARSHHAAGRLPGQVGSAADYPMTAKGYSERRSALAKSLGPGRKPSEPVKAPTKVSKPRSKASAFAKMPSTTTESVHDPAEVTAMSRPNTMAPVKAEAPTTAPANVQEPIEAVQEAA